MSYHKVRQPHFYNVAFPATGPGAKPFVIPTVYPKNYVHGLYMLFIFSLLQGV